MFREMDVYPVGFRIYGNWTKYVSVGSKEGQGELPPPGVVPARVQPGRRGQGPDLARVLSRAGIRRPPATQGAGGELVVFEHHRVIENANVPGHALEHLLVQL